MKIIAGLGNPGTEYRESRHNVGFIFLDALAEHLAAEAWREKDQALVAEIRATEQTQGEKIIFIKPLTYMNNSGEAIAPLMHWYKLTADDLLVVHDDMDLPTGMIRIRPKGSSGGHNGLKSIIGCLGTEKFARFKIGIGHPAVQRTTINHVLSPFMPEEKEKICEAVKILLPAALCWVADGIDMTMNRFNPVRRKTLPQNLESATEVAAT